MGRRSGSRNDLRASQSRALLPVSASNSGVSPFPIVSLAANYGELFLSKEFSDVSIIIGQNYFRAHKLVLSARVPYFKRLFLSGMRESQTGQIEITDVDVIRFYHVLKFIYSGEFPEDLGQFSESYLQIADKYGIEDLKLACSASLKSQLQPENVIQTMILADMHQCHPLKNKCVRAFTEWKRDVARSDIAELVHHPQLMLECLLQL